MLIRTPRALLMLSLIAGCATPPPLAAPAVTPQQPVRLEPAPRPFVSSGRRAPSGGLELPPKMPLGTGAVPVSGGAARGSIVTGLRESF